MMRKTGIKRELWLCTELVAIFVVLPLVFFLRWIPGPKALPLLIVFAYALVLLLTDSTFDRRNFGLQKFRAWRPLMVRFAVVAAVMTAYVFFFEPRRILEIPLNRPGLWLMIMLFYPLWSAFPQEVIYRGFFRHRYRSLFTDERIFMLVNALLFAFLHIIFRNWIAVAGGFLAGILWWLTYRRSGSLLVTSAEHALYGNFIYTIGLGHHFYMPDFA